MTIVCPKCQLQLRPKKNSVGVESMGDSESYQYFHADLWECPACEMQVIAGFGQTPIAEHYQKPRYETVVEAERKITTVYRFWSNREEKERFEAGKRE